MGRSLQRPIPKARLLLSLSSILIVGISLNACRPPLEGPTPWNILVISLERLSVEQLEGVQGEQLPLVGDAVRFPKATASQTDKHATLGKFWVGHSLGMASGIMPLPELLMTHGVMTGAMIAGEQADFDPYLLKTFQRVEFLSTKPSPADRLLPGLRSWLKYANEAAPGGWLLWQHGSLDTNDPADFFANVKAELATAGNTDNTLVVVIGIDPKTESSHIPLAIYSPFVPPGESEQVVHLQDVAPTIAERIGHHLLICSLAEHPGDGVSLTTAMLGLPLGPRPLQIASLPSSTGGKSATEGSFTLTSSPMEPTTPPASIDVESVD